MVTRWIACSSFALSTACQAPPDDRPALVDDASIPVSAAAELPAATPADSRSEADAALDRLSATYTFVGGEREHKGLIDAIEAVVGDMNLFVRDIARDRLRASNEVPSALAIHRIGRRVTVSFDERTYTAELGGPPVTVQGATGDPVRLTYRLQGQRLIQDFRGERGGRVNAFYVDAEGRLRIDVKVHSPKLPKDLLYRLSFGKRA